MGFFPSANGAEKSLFTWGDFICLLLEMKKNVF